MNILDFKAQSLNREEAHACVDGKWITAIDVGYSGCKIFAQNKVAVFPYMTKIVDTEAAFNKLTDATDMFYSDDTGEIWAVGESAVKRMKSNDTSINTFDMYKRQRYSDREFEVILRTALAVSLQNNRFGNSDGKELFVQTGLPADFEGDKNSILKAFCKKHIFSVKIGSGPWKKYNFELDKNHVAVMAQPKGTLTSIVMADNGEFTKEGKKLLTEQTLIFDAGFNTLDVIQNVDGILQKPSQTYDNLGMKQVFLEAIKDINKKFNVDIDVPYMQHILTTGKVEVFDMEKMSRRYEDISDIIKNKSEIVCERAIVKIAQTTNGFESVKNIVITGGTGEAWFDQIKNILKNFEGLNIVPGNKGTDLPFTFSNVRGYYLFRYNQLLRENKR